MKSTLGTPMRPSLSGMQLSLDPSIADQQMRAFIFCLLAFGYIDGDLAPSEQELICDQLAYVAATRAQGDESVADELHARYHALLAHYDAVVRGHFSESVADGESSLQFVTNKLKLGCFERLSQLDAPLQQAVVATVERLMHADGRVHPNEATFFAEVLELVHAPIELDETDLQAVAAAEVLVESEKPASIRVQQEPSFFHGGEWDFSRDPATFAQQSTADLGLVERVKDTLASLRDTGHAKLATLSSLDELPFGSRSLDGGVYLQRPDPARHYELLVLGDLHGCYSCMKAAILQADFFDKLQKHRDDPAHHPEIGIVLLGDYIDRGKFGYAGTLRAALQLFAQMPNEVVLLRGNHEHYLEIHGRVVAPVRPCEALDSLKTVDGARLLQSYRGLFEQLPTSFLFGNVMFVHGGIPRDETLEQRWRGLASLNDPELAFERLWSDPCDAEVVPRELQQEVARFGFGRRQFQRFMSMVGCRVMIRGHERIVEGFKKTYDDPEALLLTLFTAGGADNRDLPPESNYREVVPMALTIHQHAGVTRITPFRVDYARYNDAAYNAFFAADAADSSAVGGA